MTEQQVREELKQCVRHQGLKLVAETLGVSISYLHDVVRSRRKPGRKLLKGMGIEKKVEYIRA